MYFICHLLYIYKAVIYLKQRHYQFFTHFSHQQWFIDLTLRLNKVKWRMVWRAALTILSDKKYGSPCHHGHLADCQLSMHVKRIVSYISHYVIHYMTWPSHSRGPGGGSSSSKWGRTSAELIPEPIRGWPSRVFMGHFSRHFSQPLLPGSPLGPLLSYHNENVVHGKLIVGECFCWKFGVAFTSREHPEETRLLRRWTSFY